MMKKVNALKKWQQIDRRNRKKHEISFTCCEQNHPLKEKKFTQMHLISMNMRIPGYNEDKLSSEQAKDPHAEYKCSGLCEFNPLCRHVRHGCCSVSLTFYLHCSYGFSGRTKCNVHSQQEQHCDRGQTSVEADMD